MKKLYLLSLCCLAALSGFGQTIVTLWSTGAAASYTSGNATATTRTDGNIVSTSTTQKGYAVFDLTSIPAGSTINSCTIGFYVSTYGAGAAAGWNTIGYPGDLSTVTVAATLFGDMTAPPGTSISTATYGTATGNQTIASTAAIASFIQANAGTKVSICWTGGGTATYTIRGETGVTTSVTTANHAPYLTISYCPPPTVVTATPSPGALCQGAVLSLTGTGGGSGTLSWSWTGPGGFTSTLISPSLTTGPASGGVYSLTVTNTCGTGAATASAVTSTVTLNPLPAISGSLNVCTGGTSSLTGAPTGGAWVSTIPTTATIDPASGLVSGVATGTTVITYTLPTTCAITATVTDNPAPGTTTGPSSVCVGGTIVVSNPVPGGTWSNDASGNAVVDASGNVTGMAGGPATIYYTTGGCSPASFPITVVPPPLPVTGFNFVCAGDTTRLADATTGGTWSCAPLTVASISPTGLVTGIASGAAVIAYTDPITTCQSTLAFSVDPLPPPISGPTGVCLGSTITLLDAVVTDTWSGGGAYATISAIGDVSTIAAGVAIFTYTDPTTFCATYYSVSVNPLPVAIVGSPTVCQGADFTFTDVDPGGSWTSSNTATATVGIASGIVAGVSAGNVNISYTLPTGCAIAYPVTINAAPASAASAAGSTTFCSGGSVGLSGTPTTGYTYQWANSGVAIPGATNISYLATASGSYTLITTNGIGCSASSTAIIVVAGITAMLNNSTTLNFCTGSDVMLTANTGGAVGLITYQWKKNGVSIAAATNNTYDATVSGAYSCLVNVSGGSGICSVISDTDNVLAYALPTPAVAFNGTSLSTASSYSHYQWYLNTLLLSGYTSYSMLPPGNGSYVVEVVDGNGCSNFSAPYELTNVGVPMLLADPQVVISPNPATTSLHIDATIPVDAVITDLAGRELLSLKNAADVNVSSLPAGIYFITLTGPQHFSAVSKFVKQ